MTLWSKSLLPFALAALAWGASGCDDREPLEVANQVDYDRFSGRWYEIARLPRATQKDCYGTTSFYERSGADSLRITHECALGKFDGPYHGVETSATMPDAAEPAKLSVKINIYRGDYWVLEVGEGYEYAVVGHPSRDYLWILSRTPQLPDDVLQGILSRTKAKKFDVDRLEYTPQRAALP
ncbi:MAG TPA: lipocalin family protein [Polyangiaceae bacterium]|nr:lipocalin family protein [Polyangiaceae bacterium]